MHVPGNELAGGFFEREVYQSELAFVKTGKAKKLACEFFRTTAFGAEGNGFANEIAKGTNARFAVAQEVQQFGMYSGEAAHVRAGLGIVLQEGEVDGLFAQPISVVEASSGFHQLNAKVRVGLLYLVSNGLAQLVV